MSHILAIDQGTTSSRAIIFDKNMKAVQQAQREFKQHFPRSGWVEHDPEEIWQSVVKTCREAVKAAKSSKSKSKNQLHISAIGITNQRETVVVWDKRTGKPIYNAIVWQDRRTADYCAKLKAKGHEAMVTKISGLLLDPYFSSSKLAWLLKHVKGARSKAKTGELLFGTIDSFLIWRLTKGRVHATDATNAARTMLYDIHKGEWSSELCELFRIPKQMLPQVKDCSADFGTTDILGDIGGDAFGKSVPIAGVAGDQQAATIGQACFKAGMMKSTYGTGCFALLNTGDVAVRSKSRLLTTIAYQLDGKVTYALEGSIFIAGAVVQWLRDGLQIIDDARATQALAKAADPNQDLILVPAFTGLGAPYWRPDCRGAIFGLARNSGKAELTKAALESVGFQTRDLLEAMRADWPELRLTTLKVDGGMAASDYTMQFLSDILRVKVQRPKVLETTALGAAWLAGMRVKLYQKQGGFAKSKEAAKTVDKVFAPQMSKKLGEAKYAKWKNAVELTIKA